jgi:hypothetical protein
MIRDSEGRTGEKLIVVHLKLQSAHYFLEGDKKITNNKTVSYEKLRNTDIHNAIEMYKPLEKECDFI